MANSFAAEFEAILRAANTLDPDLANWRFVGLDVTNVAEGRYHPDNQFWHPDRADIIQLARRMTELRMQRWNGKAVRQPIEEWRAQMQQHFGFTAPVGVGGGWRDCCGRHSSSVGLIRAGSSISNKNSAVSGSTQSLATTV